MKPAPSAAEPQGGGSPGTLRELLAEGMQASRANFRSLYPAVAIPLAVASAAVTILQASWLSHALSAGPIAPAGPFVHGVLALVLVVVLTLLIRAVAYSVLMNACIESRLGAGGAGWASWRIFVRRGAPATLLLGLASAVLAGLLLVVPALYVATLLIFLVPVVRVEGTTGIDALRRSAALVGSERTGHIAQRSAVRAFLVGVGGTVMAYLANMVVQLPFVLAQQVIIWRNAGEGAGQDPVALRAGLLWMQLPATVAGALAEAAVMIQVCSTLAALYAGVRRRREGQQPTLAADGGAPSPVGLGSGHS